MATTIQVEERTRHRLEGLKMHSRETYNDVIKRLLENGKGEGIISETSLRNIESALEDIRKGRVYSTNEVRKRFGLDSI